MQKVVREPQLALISRNDTLGAATRIKRARGTKMKTLSELWVRASCGAKVDGRDQKC